MSVTTDRYPAALQTLSRPPKLIITDSQVFPYIYENKPKESMLTSFSVLFAAYKGDLSYYIEGAKAIDSLKVPVTNYGITIAHLTGILDHVALPE